MTVTVLGPGGYSRPPYGLGAANPFAGKTQSSTNLFTVSGDQVSEKFKNIGVSHPYAGVSSRTQ